MLDFKPSEVSFYEGDAQTFLVLDKDDPERKVKIKLIIIEILMVIQLIHKITALFHQRFWKNI
jgi:hypothetical protein